ncbi:hypothetical protein PVAP13_7KG047000 [Panicum virgatum]|uniref:Uncharacterized protein n=1 Tax=Panicum virgatum TaxID=38727 RepID=A0A8T0QC09_PANVG|nr:hypothetical protein PVAP13_7KG047000 [Panicum virgatum]
MGEGKDVKLTLRRPPGCHRAIACSLSLISLRDLDLVVPSPPSPPHTTRIASKPPPLQCRRSAASSSRPPPRATALRSGRRRIRDATARRRKWRTAVIRSGTPMTWGRIIRCCRRRRCLHKEEGRDPSPMASCSCRGRRPSRPLARRGQQLRVSLPSRLRPRPRCRRKLTLPSAPRRKRPQLQWPSTPSRQRLRSSSPNRLCRRRPMLRRQRRQRSPTRCRWWSWTTRRSTWRRRARGTGTSSGSCRHWKQTSSSQACSMPPSSRLLTPRPPSWTTRSRHTRWPRWRCLTTAGSSRRRSPRRCSTR